MLTGPGVVAGGQPGLIRLQLTKAGAVLLEAARTVLSLVDHEVNRTRQAAGPPALARTGEHDPAAIGLSG